MMYRVSGTSTVYLTSMCWCANQLVPGFNAAFYRYNIPYQLTLYPLLSSSPAGLPLRLSLSPTVVSLSLPLSYFSLPDLNSSTLSLWCYIHNKINSGCPWVHSRAWNCISCSTDRLHDIWLHSHLIVAFILNTFRYLMYIMRSARPADDKALSVFWSLPVSVKSVRF